MPFFTNNIHGCHSRWRIAAVLAALLLAAPKLEAEAPGKALRQAEIKRENELVEENTRLRKQAEAAKRELAKQRAENAQSKTDRTLEQQAKELEKQREKKLSAENVQLRKQADAAERELAKQLAANAQPKIDPVAAQRAKQLEKEKALIQRKAEAAEAKNQHLEKQLAEAAYKTEQAEAKLKQADRTKSAQHTNVSVPNPLSAMAASFTVGSTIKDCNDCPELVVIPSDTFMMGSPDNEKDREGDEDLHTVTIGYTLAVGKYEVSFAEWDACVAAGGCTYKPDDQWGRDNQPVINVSWNDITQQYLPWLNRKTGLNGRPADRQYRLLTEAEWEYAARAGTTTAFAFGDRISTDQANYTGNQTVPVTSFAPNAWGLYNMHGNVWEWVEDCYKRSYSDAPNDGGARVEGCSWRVLRGGSWYYFPGGLRSASRNGFTPVSRNYGSGFRLARMLP